MRVVVWPDIAVADEYKTEEGAGFCLAPSISVSQYKWRHAVI